MTDVLLTNRALRQAKLDTIDSLDDDTAIASYCKETLPLVIEEGLTEHDWGFARKRTTLLELATITYGNWLHVFDDPDDMVQPQKYLPTGSDPEIAALLEEEYEIFENSELADRASGRIACNEPNLDLIYTKRMTVIPHLPYYFAEAITYLFAYHLSSTQGGSERADRSMAMWIQQKLPWAIGKDNDRRRNNVKGISTLTTDDAHFYDPFGYSK